MDELKKEHGLAYSVLCGVLDVFDFFGSARIVAGFSFVLVLNHLNGSSWDWFLKIMAWIVGTGFVVNTTKFLALECPIIKK